MESLKNAIFTFSVLMASSVFAQIKMEFITIPEGTFTMRRSPINAFRNTDKERVKVTISKPFEMMKTEVTQNQWFDVMKNNPSKFKTSDDCNNHLKIGEEDLCPNHPIEQVSWNQIQTYIKRLNEAEGLMGLSGNAE